MLDRRWQTETAATLLWYELVDAGVAAAVARGRASVSATDLPTGKCHVSVERVDGEFVAALLRPVPADGDALDDWAAGAAQVLVPFLEEFLAPVGVDDELSVLLRRAADALAAIGAAVDECHLVACALADRLGTVGYGPTKEEG